VPLKAGRVFTDADRDGAERAVIVNETLARRAFGDGDPIGQILHLSTGSQVDEEWRVVGVAGDVKIESLADPDASKAEVYVPYAQHLSGDTAFALRTSGEPMALAQAVRELFHELDADRPLTRMTPLDALVSDSVAIERFRSRFVGAFAILAIALAVVGIYGVRAFTVGQRHRELGIRLALGAPPREIVRLVAGQGVALSMAGLAVGGAAALYIGRAMSALLFGVEGGDPAILAAGLLAVVAAAALAGYIPARRAARIDPAIVLRAE
jgi:putative ABC transport system permease protein